jgi:hypothetical protein
MQSYQTLQFTIECRYMSWRLSTAVDDVHVVNMLQEFF